MAVNACENCGTVFANRYQLGPHRRVCVPAIEPLDPAFVITQPVNYGAPPALYELAQRAPGFGEERQLETPQLPPYTGMRTRDYTDIQRIWASTVLNTHACVDGRFWKVYKCVQSQTIICRDNVLAATKDILLDEEVLANSRTWPRSHRSLRNRVIKKTGGYFWDMVTQNFSIDLTQFNLPGCDRVKFEFIDPIWVYIQRCQALTKQGLHLEWEATSLVNPAGEELFGSGIQHGLLFRDAAQTIPSNGKVALINLSFDSGNTVYTGRGACPILLQLMNINCSNPSCIALLGYMPVIQIDKDVKGFGAAKQHVVQTCIGHILDHIEAYARHGFKCTIGNAEMLLFPRLGAMALDTIERYKYFGLRSVRACGICRLRKGRSLARESSRHDTQHVESLLQRANADVVGEQARRRRKRSRDKLMRHGIDFKKRCRLRDHAQHCLVHISKYQPSLCAGLCRYEAMHVYFIGFCSWLLETLIELVPTKAKRNAVAKATKLCWQFRDLTTGKTHPRLQTLLRLTYYTAEKRVRAVFYWAHVLGIQADVIVTEMRVHAQSAVAALQLILIATRGHRAYTGPELDIIYKDVGRQFFVHLEAMATYLERKRFAAAERRHASAVANAPAPVPWERGKRDANVTTDTDDTDPELTWGGIGRYEYSAKGMPHCLMHARELVESGGHHGAYNTATAEATHPGVIKSPSKFSQTRASYNETHEGMLTYVCWQTLWKAAIERSEEDLRRPAARRPTLQPLSIPLPYTKHWPDTEFNRGRPPRGWKTTFLSKDVLLTREELVTLLLHKVDSGHFRAAVNSLQWQCYGAWSKDTPDGKRTFVGFSDRTLRRDFVRLRGLEGNTALTVAVKMFVKVSGFGHASGIFLPDRLRHPDNNDHSCVFAVVRWLSPHPNALLRDIKSRPICPAPFDINHALWTYSKRGRARTVFTNRVNITRQLHLFPGPNRLVNAYNLDRAMYDLIEVQTIEHVINCTLIDDSDSILETLVLPF